MHAHPSPRCVVVHTSQAAVMQREEETELAVLFNEYIQGIREGKFLKPGSMLPPSALKVRPLHAHACVHAHTYTHSTVSQTHPGSTVFLSCRTPLIRLSQHRRPPRPIHRRPPKPLYRDACTFTSMWARDARLDCTGKQFTQGAHSLNVDSLQGVPHKRTQRLYTNARAGF
eukprot:365116-Chlamydomonas_euryale.AAC.10